MNIWTSLSRTGQKKKKKKSLIQPQTYTERVHSICLTADFG